MERLTIHSRFDQGESRKYICTSIGMECVLSIMLPRFGEYKFIALDFSLSEASARHFFGEFTKSASAFLEEQAMSSEGTTVTLGHFPVSSVMHAGTSPTTLLRGVASHTLPQKSTNGSAAAVESTPSLYGALAQHHVIAHFCGHFHGLLGKVVHSWFGEYLQARHEGGSFLHAFVVGACLKLLAVCISPSHACLR